MRAFTLFTTDRRYTVPNLTILHAEREESAVRQARDDLARSEFHVAVELREGDRLLYRAARPVTSGR